MKTLAILFFLALSWEVRAFHEEEYIRALCSVPENYALRFIECTINGLPEMFTKMADVIHSCLKLAHEIDSRSEAVLKLLCDFSAVEKDEVKICFLTESESAKDPPGKEEIEKFVETAKYCLING
ncbi:venom protein 29-like [Centruroides vittatus]|uniref:venom protein 29-like n=1 Tax=Centruroides vittatus TaxID=120091 RepID=UPI0035102909